MPHYHYLRYKESTEIYLHGKVDEVFNKLTQSKKTEHFKNIYPVPLQIKTGGCVFLYSEFSVEVDKKRLYIFCRYLEQRESIEEGGVSWAELTSIFPPLPFFASLPGGLVRSTNSASSPFLLLCLLDRQLCQVFQPAGDPTDC